MKIAILTQNIPHYRRSIYDVLGKKYDLTIIHNGKTVNDVRSTFKEKIIPLRKIGPFYLLKINLHKELSQYNIIISESNIRYLDRNLLIINPFRKYKWIAWGIGVSASYGKKFDTDKKYNFFRFLLFKYADANLFYSNYPIKKYISAGFKRESLFVANNTIEVKFNNEKIYTKNSILFVGTLYKEKRIFELLISYQNALKKTNDIPQLNIIGEGSEFNSIQKWISKYNLENYVNLLGGIYDQEKLEEYFRTSIACISPGQAGLTVLTSMGYGTAFITRDDAITGGEIFNITNGITGILYKKDSELTEIIIDIAKNKEKYIKMGEQSRVDYLNHCSPNNMIKGFIDAINYVTNTE